MASTPSRPARPQPRPKVIDLNLLPPEYRRLPWSPFRLAFVAVLVAGVVALAVTGQLWFRETGEIDRLNGELTRVRSTADRLAPAQPEVEQLQSTIAADKEKLNKLTQDYGTLQGIQVRWANALDIIVTRRPFGVTLEAVSQHEKPNTISVRGFADQYSQLVDYGDGLRRSGLFSRVIIQEAQAIATPTPPITPTPVTIIFPTPVVVTPPPTGLPAAPPTPTPIPVSPSPTPSSSLDYYLLSASRLSYPGAVDNLSVIKGRVIDQQGKLVPGLQFQVSGGNPPAVMAYPQPGRPASDGTFEFLVGRGNYTLNIVGVNAEVASDLNTDVPGFTGYHVWEVAFQRAVQPMAFPRTGSPAVQSARRLVEIFSTNRVSLPTMIIPQRRALAEATPEVVRQGVSFVLILEVKQ